MPPTTNVSKNYRERRSRYNRLKDAVMSALPPPKADIRGYEWNVRFVPKADLVHLRAGNAKARYVSKLQGF